MDEERFLLAVERAKNRTGEGIGELCEKTLHSALKYYYEPDEEKHESGCGGFVADIKNADGITEIQTGSFFHLNKKLGAFLKEGSVNIVYPVVRERRIINIDPETGEESRPRRSPKRGRVEEVCRELVHIGSCLENENLMLTVPVLDADEYRVRREKKRAFHDRGYDKVDLVPRRLVDEWVFVTKDDYLRLIPPELLEIDGGFTAKELEAEANLDARLAQEVVKSLFFRGALTRKRVGRSYYYSEYRADTDEGDGR